jgi:hypothetical protein
LSEKHTDIARESLVFTLSNHEIEPLRMKV